MFAVIKRIFGKKDDKSAENRVEAYFKRGKKRANLTDKVEEKQSSAIRNLLIDGGFELTSEDPFWVWLIVVSFNAIAAVPALIVILIAVISSIGSFLFALGSFIVVVFITEGVIQLVFGPRAAGWGVGAWVLFIGGSFVYSIVDGILATRNAEKRRKEREAEEAKEAARTRDQDIGDESFIDKQLNTRIQLLVEAAYRKMGQYADETFQSPDGPETSEPMILRSGVFYPQEGTNLEFAHLNARRGTDDVVRYSCHKITIVLLQDSFMFLYACEYDGIEDRVVQEAVTEFQYQDIIAVTVEDNFFSVPVPMDTTDGDKPKDGARDKKSKKQPDESTKKVEIEAQTTNFTLRTNSRPVVLGFVANIGDLVGYGKSNDDSNEKNRLLENAYTEENIRVLREKVRAKRGF